MHRILKVYFFGGGFMYGNANVNGPNRFMASQDGALLVTFNSRLGILGYLSTGEKDLPGNWALLDQIAALEWIQKYIAYFGGDPKRVTLFGHSSGAALVHLMTLSPRAVGNSH